MENIKQLLLNKLGYTGKLISGSKSGYRKAYPLNMVFFNANICVIDGKKTVKVWWGDIDVTLSRNLIKKIANETQEDIYILCEMDARFENEKKPLIKEFVYKANADGSEELGKSTEKWYTITQDDVLEISQHHNDVLERNKKNY